MKKTISHLYIHIPFCLQKCNYCSFVSFEHKSLADIEDYFDVLRREILVVERKYQLSLDTLYIGGGTPTFIRPYLWEYLAEILSKNITLNKNAEVTVEVNPCTLRKEHFKIFREMGVNRLSIGVQSFHLSLLREMGRCHTGWQARDVIEDCIKKGFRTSGDLIYSLPHEDFTAFADDLQQLVATGVGHVSLYQLSIEKGTPWENMPRNTMTDGYAEYRYATWYLKKMGYKQYEISNFAKPGEESRHNLAYWTGDDYIGIGLSAASFVGGTRYQNTSDFETYLNSIPFLRLPIETTEKLPKVKAAGEAAMLLLRTSDGIDKGKFITRFSERQYNRIAKKLATFPPEMVVQNDQGIHLTEKGMRVANRIWQEIL